MLEKERNPLNEPDLDTMKARPMRRKDAVLQELEPRQTAIEPIHRTRGRSVDSHMPRADDDWLQRGGWAPHRRRTARAPTHVDL
jgi:hypothetical protein